MRSTRAWVFGCVGAMGLLSACLPMGAPARKISDVARDVNVATRFGRMDVALEHTAEGHRSEFLRQRADWGKEIRILDVEITRLDMKKDEDSADVFVDVGWVRMSEGLLRSTRVKQQWKNQENDWQLDAEERLSGDIGLLGENVVVLHPEAPRDVHFPVKTLQPARD
ncbi:MAG: hypothetical protein RL685_5691 [Pseudomonadota bacterium]